MEVGTAQIIVLVTIVLIGTTVMIYLFKKPDDPVWVIPEESKTQIDHGSSVVKSHNDSGKPGWLFLLLWCVICTISMPLCLLLLDFFPSQWEQSPLIFGPVNGLCFGSLQYLLLRRWLRRAWLWVIVSIFGWTLGFLLSEGVNGVARALTEYDVHGYLLDHSLSYNWYYCLLVAPGGLAIGMSQWIYLRMQRKRAVYWIPATMISFTYAGWLLKQAGMFFIHAAPFAGLAAGLATGIVLLWILRGADIK